jgi:hypothetical protein
LEQLRSHNMELQHSETVYRTNLNDLHSRLDIANSVSAQMVVDKQGLESVLAEAMADKVNFQNLLHQAKANTHDFKERAEAHLAKLQAELEAVTFDLQQVRKANTELQCDFDQARAAAHDFKERAEAHMAKLTKLQNMTANCSSAAVSASRGWHDFGLQEEKMRSDLEVWVKQLQPDKMRAGLEMWFKQVQVLSTMPQPQPQPQAQNALPPAPTQRVGCPANFSRQDCRYGQEPVTPAVSAPAATATCYSKQDARYSTAMPPVPPALASPRRRPSSSNDSSDDWPPGAWPVPSGVMGNGSSSRT